MKNPELNLLLQNTPDSIFARVDRLEQQIQELQVAELPVPEQIIDGRAWVVDLLLFPSEGVTVTDPTSTDYIGGFISGEGYDFSGNLYNMGGVNAGVIQFGVNTADGTLYAINANISGVFTVGAGSIAGGWVIDSDSIHDAAGTVGLSSAVTGGNDLRIWAGDVIPANAPFQVYEDGTVVASAITIAGASTIAGWNVNTTQIYKFSTGSTGVILDSSIPAIKVGNTAGTYILIDGANQVIKSSNYSAGLIGSSWTTSTGDAEFNNITARGNLKVTAIQSSTVMATGGTNWIVPAVGVLRDDCTSVDSPTTFAVNVKDPDGLTHAAAGTLWAVGDRIRLKEPLTGDLWASISSKTDNTTYWTLNVVKQSPGAGTNYTFRAGLAILNYGASGAGFISLSADTQMGAAPNLTMGTHAGSPWTTTTNLLRLGNLNGSYGYVSAVYGLGIGSYGVASQTSLTVDTTNGIRIINNTTTIGQWSAAGVITVGEVASGKSNVQISSGALKLRNNTTDVIVFDTAESRIDNLLKMSGASAALSIGTTPPTSATVGTGLWVDRTGVYSLASSVQQATLTSAGLSAGGGVALANVNGFEIAIASSVSDLRAYKFVDGSTVNSAINASTTAGGNTLQAEAKSITGKDSTFNAIVNSPSGKTSIIGLAVGITSVSQTGISMRWGSSSPGLTLNSGQLDMDTVIGGSGAELARFDASTLRFGIGTATPGTMLDVNGTITAGALIINGGSTVDTLLTDGTSWTPVVAGDGTAGAGTYTTQSGRYAVAGKLVFIELALIWTAHTGTGNMIITGLPFTSANNSINVPLAVQWSNVTLPAVGDKLQAIVLANNTQINLQSVGSGAAASLALDTAATIRLAGCYLRA